MPFKSDLDRTPIDVVASHYGATPNAAWTSVISVQLTVLTSAKTFAELLAAEETAVVDEVAEVGDSVILEFAGTIDPHPSTPRTAEIKVSTVTFGTDITDDGAGALSGTGCTGTIDYVTGEWTLVYAAAPTGNIEVDYTWFFVLPTEAQGFWLYPAGDIRATFSSNGTPTASTGILIGEAIFLAGQPNLIAKSSFIAGSSTLLDAEIMV